MFYFLDNNIWHGGYRYPLRRVPLVNFWMHDKVPGKVRAVDEDDDTYALNLNEIFYDSLGEREHYLQLREGDIWESETDEGVELFRREANGDFTPINLEDV